jgi:hypothetical protein
MHAHVHVCATITRLKTMDVKGKGSVGRREGKVRLRLHEGNLEIMLHVLYIIYLFYLFLHLS